ncbi:hypothetical protein WOLCODRAFT_66706, partial [Wolfiporia cocos MD-104 SS10]
EKAERLRNGLTPIVQPTAAQRLEAKKRYRHQDGLIHIAVAGGSGTGKSSFINAIRGLGNRSSSNDPCIAATGVAETTGIFGRYPDPNPDRPYVWYDIPGAGTLNVPDWQYFNDQGLYTFDRIIVLFDIRFTATDIAILRHCAHFSIPSYIVRSKSTTHIRNIMDELREEDQYEYDSEEGLRNRARNKLIADTNGTVAHNLGRVGLSSQRVYCIDRAILLKCFSGKRPKDTIDEVLLINSMWDKGGASDANRYCFLQFDLPDLTFEICSP